MLAEVIGVLAGIFAVAIVGILLDRAFGTVALVIWLGVCLIVLGWLHWDQIKPVFIRTPAYDGPVEAFRPLPLYRTAPRSILPMPQPQAQAQTTHATSPTTSKEPGAMTPGEKNAYLKLMAQLSSDLSDFADEMSTAESKLPPRETDVPAGVNPNKTPIGIQWFTHEQRVKGRFRYEQHYFQRCQRIAEVLPNDLPDTKFVKDYCGQDASQRPSDAGELKNLSSLLLKLAGDWRIRPDN